MFMRFSVPPVELKHNFFDKLYFGKSGGGNYSRVFNPTDNLPTYIIEDLGIAKKKLLNNLNTYFFSCVPFSAVNFFI